MENRYLIGGLVLVIVVSMGVYGLVGYSPASTETTWPVTEDTRSEERYTVTESISIDGTLFTARTVTHDSTTGEKHVEREFDDITHEEYLDGNGTVYTRVITTNKDKFDSMIDDYTSEEIMVRTEGNSEYRFIARSAADEDESDEETEFPEGLIGSAMSSTNYTVDESVEPSGDSTTYEPNTGWFVNSKSETSRTSVYVKNAEGELMVDDEGRLQYAHVEMDYAYLDTWGEYLMERDNLSPVTINFSAGKPTSVQPTWATDYVTE